jgi:hypothetical protein
LSSRVVQVVVLAFPALVLVAAVERVDSVLAQVYL